MSVRLVGACHIVLGAACLGAYPVVGAFHPIRQNSYLGAYPGYYGTSDDENQVSGQAISHGRMDFLDLQ